MPIQPIASRPARRKSVSRTLLHLLLVLLTAILPRANSKAKTKPVDEPFAVENYYKVKWGYADEFVDLWRKNHYPLLKKAIQKGDILSVTAQIPVLHSGEDTRWDFKVIIVYKNSERAFCPGNYLSL